MMYLVIPYRYEYYNSGQETIIEVEYGRFFNEMPTFQELADFTKPLYGHCGHPDDSGVEIYLVVENGLKLTKEYDKGEIKYGLLKELKEQATNKA